jgi:hypothetical protein
MRAGKDRVIGGHGAAFLLDRHHVWLRMQFQEEVGKPMLGYVIAEGAGVADRLLADAAQILHAEALPLVGAVQINSDRDDARPCDMDLHVIASGRIVRISQNLGSLARGCRLDPAGLEQVVGLVEQALDDTGAGRPKLLIVNKFGKQEAEGRGFRPLIGRALSEGLVVLTSVNTTNKPGFDGFAEGLAKPLAPTLPAVLDWCRKALA